MGKLIKAYAEKNGGFDKIMKKDRGDRKAKMLSKAFGGEPEDFSEFCKANEDMKVFELIEKYSQ